MTGKELRAKRRALDLTQERCAELLGVSARSILYYEKGEVAIPERIATAFGQIASLLESLEQPASNA